MDEQELKTEQITEAGAVQEAETTEDTEETGEVVNTRTDEELKGVIEATLFAMGEAVETDRLAKAIGIKSKELEALMEQLEKDYEAENRGIKLIKLENAWQLATKPDYYDVLTRLVNIPKKHSLTDTLMETLSIIAYKQPITRQEIEAIRGVSCVHAVNKLVEYNLITEVGRLDAVGRPILFGTTEDFLRCFGVSSMDELPMITPDKIEDFKKEAMEEVNIRVET
ncbi:MAG: SMC-Scp complex subunit ScpB [Lachnospiraceae bacterium]|nr:SMC-Scp complex subunit ScpB [Lachnospiraceae bacterium]